MTPKDKYILLGMTGFAILILLSFVPVSDLANMLEAPPMNKTDNSPKMYFSNAMRQGKESSQQVTWLTGALMKKSSATPQPKQTDYPYYTAKLNHTITFTSVAGSESFDAIVYRVKYAKNLTQYNRSRGKLDTISTANGSQFAVIFYRTSSSLGTSDLWMTANYTNLGIQAGNRMYFNSTKFTLEPINELAASGNPFGYLRTNNANYGPEYWIWQYYQQPGSNAHDGYIIYEVPENESPIFRANYAGFGSGSWTL